MNLLANLFRQTAIAEMGHVEKLSERILFLNGDVEMNADQPVEKIKTVKEMLHLARKMEEGSRKQYNKWAVECSANADAISKQLFESLIADEERHYDLFDKELSNIDKFGNNYLALQSMERSKSQVTPK
jgi:bacterioferritin